MESRYSKSKPSKKQYQFILNNIDEPIGILSTEYPFCFEFINEQAYQKLFKYSKSDLVGKSFLKIIPDISEPKVINTLETVSEDVLEDVISAQIKDKDNDFYNFNLHIKCFLDQNNQKKLFIKINHIKKQEPIQKKANQSNETLKEIVDNVPEIQFWNLIRDQEVEDFEHFSYPILKFVLENLPYQVCWKDKNLTYLGCNTNYAELVNLESPTEIIGKKDADLFNNQEKIEDLKRKEKLIIKSKTPQYNKIEKWETESKELTFEIYRIPLIGSNDKPLGILISYNDITEFKESEQKFRKITEQSLIGILIVQNGILKYGNRQIAKIFGYDADKTILLLERPFVEFLHPKEREKITQQLVNLSINHYQFRGIRKDGEVIWLEAYSKEIKYEGKNANLLTIIDITEKKKYEKLITELNIDFLKFTPDIKTNTHLLLQTCKELIDCEISVYIHKNREKDRFEVLTNETNTFIHFNEGKFKSDCIGAEFFKADHDIPQKLYDLDQKNYGENCVIAQNHNVQGGYGKLIKSEGKLNSCLCVFFENNPRTSYEEQLVLFSIARAIEIERKRWKVQQDLKNQNKVLNKMNKIKNELITRTSHELKTPLISIKGFTKLLLEVHSQKMDSNMLSIVESIEDGAKRLERIINTFLKSLKLDHEGSIYLNKKRNDLTITIEQCVDELEGMANLRKQTIIMDLHEHLITKFDDEKIREVIGNILVNAIKYTPPNGTITINSEVQENKYIISIEDNGIGFTENEKERLFTQFGKIERYGHGLDLDVKGIGLGLYISKQIIEFHEGRIWVESKGRNEGSTFSFSLPII